ncbi:MAG: DEAD/DEAH box helicase [Bacteroidales bacterium]
MNTLFAALLQEHKKFGLLLYPFLLKDLGKDYYRIHDRLSIANLKHHQARLNDAQQKIVHLVEEYSDQQITKRFTNKKVKSRDFVAGLEADYIQKYIRPFIEKQMAGCIRILVGEGLPLFYRETQNVVYSSNQVKIEKEPAGVIFNFKKLESETHYWQTIKHEGEMIRLTGKTGTVITDEPCWLQIENRLYHFKQKVEGKKLKVFFDKEFVQVPQKLEEKFYSTFVKDCIRDYPVRAEGFEITESSPKCRPQISYGTDFQGLPGLFLSFFYNDWEADSRMPHKVKVKKTGTGNQPRFELIRRDPESENIFAGKLEELGLKHVNENKHLIDVADNNNGETNKFELIGWLNRHAVDLRKEGFIIGQEIADIRYHTGQVEMVLDVSENNDWFDVYAVARFGNDIEIPIIKLRKHLLNRIREYVLPDGSIAILPESWFEKYSDLLSFGEKAKKGLRIKKMHYPLVDRSMQNSIRISRKSAELFSGTSLSGKIRMPEGLNASLRDYQRKGFQWLNLMRKYKLGGCLADDMGLGKTLQTLTLLLKHSEENNYRVPESQPESHGQLDLFGGTGNAGTSINPSLVIMPASLIHNWENEIKKFAPRLSYLNYTGPQRFDLQEKFTSVHLVLTTYGTIRNDYQDFEELTFDYIILDESQMIKNPGSKAARAIYRLKAKHKVILSGTPIENTLIDLWSQMNFLNPGLLGDLQFFKRYFATPIEKNNDEERQEKLHLLIKPFILRRTKNQVEKELPELSEEYIYCEMSPEQQQIYLQEKSSIRNFILEQIEKKGTEKSAIIVLQALTKLRQMANHPLMIDQNYRHDSGKFEEVIRNLETLISEGHKVLIFSSFVKHLDIFARHFKETGIGYSILTGETRHRQEVIREFQEDPARNIFLISIKAGGVGLNLTEAEYVFLLDPWWNPAVENQAINRAHRIGQTRHVFAYRFITLNTIEEKILRLQQRKSKLADLFIRTDNPLKELNVSEIKELID